MATAMTRIMELLPCAPNGGASQQKLVILIILRL